MYSFCPKNSTIDSKKTSITQEWLVVESLDESHFNALSIGVQLTFLFQ